MSDWPSKAKQSRAEQSRAQHSTAKEVRPARPKEPQENHRLSTASTFGTRRATPLLLYGFRNFSTIMPVVVY